MFFFTALTSAWIHRKCLINTNICHLLNEWKAMGEMQNTLGAARKDRKYNLLRGVRVDFVKEVIFSDGL